VGGDRPLQLGLQPLEVLVEPRRGANSCQGAQVPSPLSRRDAVAM
jgi:hypothetical protein